MRREGRPGEKGILTSRVIDRPIRPLFPSDFRNDVSVMCTVMSMDHDCSAEIAALIGTSAALAISDIPWNGPVGALRWVWWMVSWCSTPTVSSARSAIWMSPWSPPARRWS